jgi:UDP:flavonoid glycosyltransferase YjiC (YdhE family)
LPIANDQPLVALRICDELNFGIRLDTKKFTSDQMKIAIKEVLTNRKYQENILEFTEISKKINGCELGANLIENYLNS